MVAQLSVLELKYGRDYLNLTKTGMQPKLNLYHSNGSVWLDEDLFIPIPEVGLIQYDISSNVIRHDGTVSAKLFLENGNKSIHVVLFLTNSSLYPSNCKGISFIIVKSLKFLCVLSFPLSPLGPCSPLSPFGPTGPCGP